jgi:hypothetical protein
MRCLLSSLKRRVRDASLASEDVASPSQSQAVQKGSGRYDDWTKIIQSEIVVSLDFRHRKGLVIRLNLSDISLHFLDSFAGGSLTPRPSD